MTGDRMASIPPPEPTRSRDTASRGVVSLAAGTMRYPGLAAGTGPPTPMPRIPTARATAIAATAGAVMPIAVPVAAVPVAAVLAGAVPAVGSPIPGRRGPRDRRGPWGR